MSLLINILHRETVRDPRLLLQADGTYLKDIFLIIRAHRRSLQKHLRASRFLIKRTYRNEICNIIQQLTGVILILRTVFTVETNLIDLTRLKRSPRNRNRRLKMPIQEINALSTTGSRVRNPSGEFWFAYNLSGLRVDFIKSQKRGAVLALSTTARKDMEPLNRQSRILPRVINCGHTENVRRLGRLRVLHNINRCTRHKTEFGRPKILPVALLVVRQNDVEKSAFFSLNNVRPNIEEEGVAPVWVFYHLLRVGLTVKEVAKVGVSVNAGMRGFEVRRTAINQRKFVEFVILTEFSTERRRRQRYGAASRNVESLRRDFKPFHFRMAMIIHFRIARIIRLRKRRRGFVSIFLSYGGGGGGCLCWLRLLVRCRLSRCCECRRSNTGKRAQTQQQ